MGNKESFNKLFGHSFSSWAKLHNIKSKNVWDSWRRGYSTLNIRTKTSGHHPLKGVYSTMLARCYNPKNPKYGLYGAKGVRVCARWFYSFDNFLEDVGNRPDGYSLDRKDPTKGYSKDNCRWADIKTQSRNKINTTSSSGSRGVKWRKNRNRWISYIYVEGEFKYLGSFIDKEAALRARMQADRLYYPEIYKYRSDYNTEEKKNEAQF